jgi:drug/metabolite transporter (DMT)-like permease
MGEKHQDHHIKGILFIILGLFSFVTANLALRFLDQSYSPTEILFFRYFFGLIPALGLLHWIYGWESLKTNHLKTHALRGIFGALSIGCLFQSILILPFADATVLTFCSSLFLVGLAATILGERIGWRGWGCVLFGLSGVMIIANPSGGGATFGILLGVTSAFIEGSLMVHNRIFTRQESGGGILFYQTVFSLLACSLFLPWVWITPTFSDAVLMAVLGLGGGVGQYFVIKAYLYAPARLLAPMIYTPIIWSVAYGYLFFGENPTILFFLGAGLIIASGLLVMYVEKRYSTTNELTSDA